MREFCKSTTGFTSPEQWAAVHQTLQNLAVENGVTEAAIDLIRSGIQYIMGLSLGRPTMEQCKKQAASPDARSKISAQEGSSDAQVKFVLEYLGQHGGIAKSCESSTKKQGTVQTYTSTRRRTVKGDRVMVKKGYDAVVRILTAAGIDFDLSVTPVLLCPEPADLGRSHIANVGTFRIISEAINIELLGST